MTTLRVVLAILAVWRVTHLLHAEDGPLRIFAGIRIWLRRMSLSGATDCFYCLSLWVSAPFAMMLGSRWEDRIILWLALSGAAILANRLTEEESEGAWFYEEAIEEEKSICPVAEMEEEY
ncbi:MAG: hypothetical protein V4587_12935 [Acidobacteriota bacterium]